MDTTRTAAKAAYKTRTAAKTAYKTRTRPLAEEGRAFRPVLPGGIAACEGARQDVIRQSLSCLTVPYCTAVANKVRSVCSVPNTDMGGPKKRALRWNLCGLLPVEFLVVDCLLNTIPCHWAL